MDFPDPIPHPGQVDKSYNLQLLLLLLQFNLFNQTNQSNNWFEGRLFGLCNNSEHKPALDADYFCEGRLQTRTNHRDAILLTDWPFSPLLSIVHA
jgi:hypothetical protein